MGTVLGLVGSVRRWGNSDLLVRHALRGARLEGAAVHAIRLTDLRLLPCTGCMRCVMEGQPCPVEDDACWLVDQIDAADGLVLAAPIYFLAPAATIKLVLDRLLMVTGRVNDPLPRPRPALTIATAGLEAWRGVGLPFLNALASAFGYRPIDSLVALAPGPGEILLNDAVLDRVLAAGRRVGRGDLGALPAAPNACPTCRCECFTLDGGEAVCPICGRRARIVLDGGQVALRFDDEGGHGRWTAEGMRAHMIDWVMATGPRYMARRQEVKARRAPYREDTVEWLRPPGAAEEAG